MMVEFTANLYGDDADELAAVEGTDSEINALSM